MCRSIRIDLCTFDRDALSRYMHQVNAFSVFATKIDTTIHIKKKGKEQFGVRLCSWERFAPHWIGSIKDIGSDTTKGNLHTCAVPSWGDSSSTSFSSPKCMGSSWGLFWYWMWSIKFLNVHRSITKKGDHLFERGCNPACVVFSSSSFTQSVALHAGHQHAQHAAHNTNTQRLHWMHWT
jgi:hypothetical protein